jgi:serine/threonine protein kinase/Tol biopolymer transport system component
MGEVYRARDTRLDRIVAIKVLPDSTAGDPQFRDRFEREARAASALNHPNILSVFDVGRQDDIDFLVTELVDGVTLRERLADGPLAPRDVVHVGAQIADGLAAAHGAGLVHRDLKPDNVMVARDGRVKILDFGLAKPLQDVGGNQETRAEISQAGLLVGTMGYVSPEQVRGLPADARSDLFALGVVLYEMATGQRAFSRPTTVETLNAILKEDVPDLPETLPAGLRQIIEHCLEKEPIRRFQSAPDVAFALRSFASTSSTRILPHETPRGRSASRAKWLAVPVAGAVLVAAGMALVPRTADSSFDHAALRLSPFAVEPERESHPAFAPDGRSVAYVREVEPGVEEIVVRSDQASAPTVLVRGLRKAWQIFWAPDGERLYFLDRSVLKSVSAVGGEVREEIQGVHAAALAPDGRTFAIVRATSSESLVTARLFTGPLSQLREYEPAPVVVRDTCEPNVLRFSPDGTKILLWFACGDPEMLIVPSPDREGRGGPGRKVFLGRTSLPSTGGMDDSLIYGADWLSDSRHVVLAVRGSLWLGDSTSGSLERITTGTTPVILPSVSRNDTIAFVDYVRDHEVVELPIEGGSPRLGVSSSQYDGSAVWSAVGDRLAYVADRGRGDEIWLRGSSDFSERRVFGLSDFRDRRPDVIRGLAFSPDAQWLAFTSFSNQPTATANIWIVPVTGGTPRLISPPDRLVTRASWSPDGRSMAMEMPNGLSGELWIVGVGTSAAPRRLALPPGVYPWHSEWSPTGEWIAAMGRGPGASKGETLLINPASGETRMLPPLLYQPRAWSRDGKTIYTVTTDAASELRALDVATGTIRTVARYNTRVRLEEEWGGTLRLSLDPTGRRFVSTSFADRSNIWTLTGIGASRGEGKQ